MDVRNRDESSKIGADGRAAASSRRHSAVTAILFVLAAWLVVDAIAGERGWLANRRARVQLEQQQQALDRVRWENASRRDLIRRLQNEDPATIEEIARRERGFIKPGEKLFIIRDVPQQNK